jgi:hypothetical protein
MTQMHIRILYVPLRMESSKTLISLVVIMLTQLDRPPAKLKLYQVVKCRPLLFKLAQLNHLTLKRSNHTLDSEY